MVSPPTETLAILKFGEIAGEPVAGEPVWQSLDSSHGCLTARSSDSSPPGHSPSVEEVNDHAGRLDLLGILYRKNIASALASSPIDCILYVAYTAFNDVGGSAAFGEKLAHAYGFTKRMGLILASEHRAHSLSNYQRVDTLIHSVFAFSREAAPEALWR